MAQAEREEWGESSAKHGVLETWSRDDHWIGDDILRLIADVERLEAERDKFRDLTKRAAAGGLPLAGVDVAELIDKLEGENKRLRDILRLGLHHGGAMHECPPECHDWEVAARAAVEQPHE